MVSIIIPNYNHARFLRRRLDSVFQQSFQDFEVILLDDASTDESISILQEYQYLHKSKISYFIINKENGGSPFPQWKKGLELAKGKYVWMAESDDSAELQLLETAMRAFTKVPELSAYITASKSLEGSEIAQPPPFDQQAGLVKLKATHFFSRCPIYNASSCIFKREAITRLETLKKYKIIADKVFWSSVLSEKLVYFDTKFYNLTNTNNLSFSRNRKTDPVKELKTLNEHRAFLQEVYKKTGYSEELHLAIKKYSQRLTNRKHQALSAPLLYSSTWMGYRQLLLRISL